MKFQSIQERVLLKEQISFTVFKRTKKKLIETGEYKIVKEFKIPKTALLQKVKD